MRRIVLLGIWAGLLLNLAFTGVARADNCSGKSDCLATSGFNTAVAVTGAGIALTAGLLGPLIGGFLVGDPSQGGGAIANAVPQDPLGLAAQYSDLCNSYQGLEQQVTNLVSQRDSVRSNWNAFDNNCADMRRQLNVLIGEWKDAMIWRKIGLTAALTDAAAAFIPEGLAALALTDRTLAFLQLLGAGGGAGLGVFNPYDWSDCQRAIDQCQASRSDIDAKQPIADKNFEDQFSNLQDQIDREGQQLVSMKQGLFELAGEMSKNNIPFTPCASAN